MWKQLLREQGFQTIRSARLAGPPVHERKGRTAQGYISFLYPGILQMVIDRQDVPYTFPRAADEGFGDQVQNCQPWTR